MIKYQIKKKKNIDDIIVPDIISFVLGDDIKNIKVIPSEGIIEFDHPSGARIRLTKCEYKDYIIQFLSEYHRTSFKIEYKNSKYKFKYKIKRGNEYTTISATAKNTTELLIILQEIIKDLAIYNT